ncbi:interleukin 17a/f3 [Astyanax mexicanus]|uniref:interleukin 17a/f3 n=1 Tax=Astyanax mexicanus TaxID=7994 RepID=UPI0020CB2239|nr:interleukin 17a/f3 [Astyanax mexicanus]
MQLSTFFRTVLVLGLVVVLLGEVCSSAQSSGGKKKGKCKAPAVQKKQNKGCRGKARKLCITVDPAVIHFTDSSPVAPDRSISPWTYEEYYDESRIPSRIFQAKCKKTGCMTKDGHEDIGLKSKPIYYQILVLKRMKGDNNSYYFQLETMNVSVGCTCVKPFVISQKE